MARASCGRFHGRDARALGSLRREEISHAQAHFAGLCVARTKGGAIVGYEQPLAKRLYFIVDWFSGDNRFGYVSPGLSFATTKDSALTAGYAIANQGRGKISLFVYYGKQF